MQSSFQYIYYETNLNLLTKIYLSSDPQAQASNQPVPAANLLVK